MRAFCSITTGVIRSRCSVLLRASAHIPPDAPGATFAQRMHVARAYKNKIETGTLRIGARCSCGRPIDALKLQRSLLWRSSLLPSCLLLLL